MSPRRSLVALVAIVGVMLALYGIVANAGVAWDTTAEGSATLSTETLRVVHALHRRIEITAFFPRDQVGRVEAATILERYRKENRRITFRILDPTLAPGEAARLGVEETGSAALQDVSHPKDIEIAPYTIEIDLTSAIARLVRNVNGTICFVSGHGERSPKDTSEDGLSTASALLESNGYKVRGIDLLASVEVPPACDAVVVASPTTRISSEAGAALNAHTAAGGKTLVLGDPASKIDLSPLSQPWGIRFASGIVLEGDASAHLPNDVSSPIVTHYAGGLSLVRGLGPTFFPRAMGLTIANVDDPGLTITPVALTSSLGYLDRDDVSSFDPKVDVKGPIAVGAAADKSLVERPGTPRAHIRRTRVLAWGDVDWATNRFFADGANARLWLQSIDWLTQPEDLVTAVPNFPKVRDLKLTAARSHYMLFLMAGVVPGLFLIAGGLVWVLRRGR